MVMSHMHLAALQHLLHTDARVCQMTAVTTVWWPPVRRRLLQTAAAQGAASPVLDIDDVAPALHPLLNYMYRRAASCSGTTVRCILRYCLSACMLC